MARPQKKISQEYFCKKCNTTKPCDQFNQDKRAKTGRQSSCKSCQKKYYFENIESYKELKNGNKKYVERSKEYFRLNKESINEYKRNRYSTEYGKAKVKALNQKRRADKVSTSDGTVTSKFILELMVNQEFKCAISNVDIKDNYHIDHIIPLSKGGKHTAVNIQLLHPSVNMSKKDKIL